MRPWARRLPAMLAGLRTRPLAESSKVRVLVETAVSMPRMSCPAAWVLVAPLTSTMVAVTVSATLVMP